MDSFFGIGGWEVIVILIIGGLVMGPERIRDMARWLGRMTAQMQGISRQFMRQLNAELDGDEREALREAMADMQALRKEVTSLRQELVAGPQAALREGVAAVDEAGVARSPQTSNGVTTANHPPPAADEIGSIAPPVDDSLPAPVTVPDDPLSL